MGNLLRAVQGEPNILDAFLRAQAFQQQIGEREQDKRLQLAQQALARMYRQQDLDYRNREQAAREANYAREAEATKAALRRQNWNEAINSYGQSLVPNPNRHDPNPPIGPPQELTPEQLDPILGPEPYQLALGFGLSPEDANLFAGVAPGIKSRAVQSWQEKQNQSNIQAQKMADEKARRDARGMDGRQPTLKGQGQSDGKSRYAEASAKSAQILRGLGAKWDAAMPKMAAAANAAQRPGGQYQKLARDTEGNIVALDIDPFAGFPPEMKAAYDAARNGQPDLARAIRNKWTVDEMVRAQHGTSENVDAETMQAPPALPQATPQAAGHGGRTGGKPLTKEVTQRYAASGLSKEQAKQKAEAEGYVW